MSKIGYIFITSIITGILTFYLAGGIDLLASDVGESGAWVILFILQLFYVLFYAIGFFFILLLSRKFDLLKPNLLSLILSSMLLSIGANLYGIFKTGPGVDFYIFGIVVMFLSTVLYGLTTLLTNICVKNT